MSKQEQFNEIVERFRNEINDFLVTKGLDEYSILVHLNEDRPTGRITTFKDELQRDVAFFDDAYFVLYQDSFKSS